jgi:hypothetical protein
VRHPGRDGVELSRSELNALGLGLEQHLTLDHEEGLVRVGMTAPVERLGHDAHPDDVVVDLGEREVRVVAACHRGSASEVDEGLLAVAAIRTGCHLDHPIMAPTGAPGAPAASSACGRGLAASAGVRSRAQTSSWLASDRGARGVAAGSWARMLEIVSRDRHRAARR